MTMDIYQRAIRADSSPPLATDAFHEQSASAAKKCQKTVKRSFDVAFLMAPDDLSKRRRDGAGAVVADGGYKKAPRYSPPSVAQASAADSFLLSALPFAAAPPQPYQLNPLRLTVHSPPAADDLICAGSHTRTHSPPRADIAPRSAFTKVANNSACVHASALEPFPRTPPVALSPSSASSTASNRSGLSPDLLAYQDSLSPQPFVPSRSPVHPLPSKHHPHHYQPPPPPPHPQPPHASPFLLKKETDRCTPPQVGQTTGSNSQFTISTRLTTDAKICALAEMDDRVSDSDAETSKKNRSRYTVPNRNASYHGDNGPAYSTFPVAGFPFSTTLAPAASNSVPMFAAAAAAAAAAANLGAALLPSSLAAFTLPAQNVCAKCNTHFRMTSDLVYHMRSQHKNENAAADAYRRRRDRDKLKCPVCRESFRERHHLTRHMTAHQDKEEEEDAVAAKEFVDIALQRAPISGSAK